MSTAPLYETALGHAPLADLDLDLDDVLDDVHRAVRRYPVAVVAIVIATVAVTCGTWWFVIRRRRDADEQADRSLAGAA